MASNNSIKSGVRVHVPNPHVPDMKEDVLYHLALGTKSHDLEAMFGDVKFVCIGGSAKRMSDFAHFLIEQLHIEIPTGMQLNNMGKGKARYAIYKAGPVLCASHGMGVPSMSILLHEVIKLLYHAKCTDVTMFRIGTSGGIGLEPGSVVITEESVNSFLEPTQDLIVLGKAIKRPAVVDQTLSHELLKCIQPDDKFKTVLGKTLCTHDFYEEQGRLDGAFCEYTEEEKMDFLQRLYEHGVRNIEMEAVAFAAMCYKANIRGAVVCCTLVNRLLGDQVVAPPEEMTQWQKRPQMIVARYIRKQLGLE